eukprot:m.1238076 g.1238076  ORF g.1238076 m.1238076 type:complete len:508 (+) comp24669_c0_seq37:381-1904(+)
MSSSSDFPDAISEAICQVAFESEDPVELSLVPGDKVYVTCKDVGGGWWEGICNGILGLFPRNYVREISVQSSPCPQSDNPVETDAATVSAAPLTSTFATTTPIPITSTNPFAPAMAKAQARTQPATLSMGVAIGNSVELCPPSTGSAPASHNIRVDGVSVTMRGQPRVHALDTIPLSSSPPAKTVFDDLKGNGETERHVTTILPGAVWQRVEEVYTVAIVKSDDKGHKYHGIKTYTVFDITNTKSNVVVQRRFKHFDWLYEQFTRTYPCIIIPLLPEKQIKGRFDAEFIERRRRRLQLFLNRVARHPVLGVSPVFQHFISAVLHKEWKAGKRKSEQQKEFLRSVQLAPQAAAVRPGSTERVEAFDADAIMESTTVFMTWLGKQIAHWHVTGEEVNATMDTLASSYDRMADVLMKFAGGGDRPPYNEWYDHVSLEKCVCLLVCLSVRLFVRGCIFGCARVSVYVYVCVCICICVYVCVYVSMHAFGCVWVSLWPPLQSASTMVSPCHQ